MRSKKFVESKDYFEEEYESLDTEKMLNKFLELTEEYDRIPKENFLIKKV